MLDSAGPIAAQLYSAWLWALESRAMSAISRCTATAASAIAAPLPSEAAHSVGTLGCTQAAPTPSMASPAPPSSGRHRP